MQATNKFAKELSSLSWKGSFRTSAIATLIRRLFSRDVARNNFRNRKRRQIGWSEGDTDIVWG